MSTAPTISPQLAMRSLRSKRQAQGSEPHITPRICACVMIYTDWRTSLFAPCLSVEVGHLRWSQCWWKRCSDACDLHSTSSVYTLLMSINGQTINIHALHVHMEEKFGSVLPTIYRNFHFGNHVARWEPTTLWSNLFCNAKRWDKRLIQPAPDNRSHLPFPLTKMNSQLGQRNSFPLLGQKKWFTLVFHDHRSVID